MQEQCGFRLCLQPPHPTALGKPVMGHGAACPTWALSRESCKAQHCSLSVLPHGCRTLEEQSLFLQDTRCGTVQDGAGGSYPLQESELAAVCEHSQKVLLDTATCLYLS